MSSAGAELGQVLGHEHDGPHEEEKRTSVCW